jgi:outer membrane PBP1 activator LpoA protein
LLLPLTGPLSGPNGDRGQAMLKSAQLAFAQPGAPALDVRDTGGTATGALTAANAAIAAHDVLIVGPLTNSETSAVAGPARAAGVPVLAFTSDQLRAQPGVWVLGLTPGQQVRRLVAQAQAQGKMRFAALLPENEFGRAMADALNDAAAAAGVQPPIVRRYPPGMAAMTAAVRDISDIANRRAPLEAQIAEAKARNDPAGQVEAAELAQRPLPPPPFDTLLLGDTGNQLAQLATLLPFYNIDIPPVQIMGPAFWSTASQRAGAGAVLNGAWYAAPDPSGRAVFDRLYTERYATAPGPLTDLVYDSASLARVVAQQGGDMVASLTRPEGFTGVDGLLGLLPDGHARRGLAVFELRGGTASILDPAPGSFTPGS